MTMCLLMCYAENQEYEGRHLFVLVKESHFGFVWECDDENAEAECRRPTNPREKLFDFMKKYFGVTKLFMVAPLLPERCMCFHVCRLSCGRGRSQCVF